MRVVAHRLHNLHSESSRTSLLHRVREHPFHLQERKLSRYVRCFASHTLQSVKSTKYASFIVTGATRYSFLRAIRSK